MAFQRSSPAVGARPGRLAIPAGSPPPRIHVIEYSSRGAQPARELALSELEPLTRAEREGVVWIDVQGLGDESTLLEIGRILDIHPLALES
jgi:magnesium transporter